MCAVGAWLLPVLDFDKCCRVRGDMILTTVHGDMILTKAAEFAKVWSVAQLRGHVNQAWCFPWEAHFVPA